MEHPERRPTRAQIEATIFALLEQRAPSASVCPSDVARALKAEESGWRGLMPAVRAIAIDLARAGRLRITRGTDVLDPENLGRGPIRLRRPQGAFPR